MEVNGVLDPYFETGTEGIMWSVLEDGKSGYEGLHTLKAGDHLTVYGTDGSTRFEGTIDPDTGTAWAEYPKNPGHGQPCVLGYWAHWTQKGMDPEEWGRLFLHEGPPLRATLKRTEG